MGMGFVPMPYGMFGSPTLSPTDAAALGMPTPTAHRNGDGDDGAGPDGNRWVRCGNGYGAAAAAASNNVFANPMSSPMLYGSMYPMTARQTGLMMLGNQVQMTGIGSGQLSGVRPGGTSRRKPAPQAAQHAHAAAHPSPADWRRVTSIAPRVQRVILKVTTTGRTRYFPQVTR